MTLSREAGERLNQYLEDMRTCHAASPAIDVGEIEQDVRDHVGAEFEGRVGPVSIEELDAVLHRLGSPRQWAAEHTLAPVEQTAGRSNDWLAYAAAGSMVIFMAFPPLLVGSWLLARWTLARIEERGEPPGTRQWLLYPPIIIVMAPLAVVGMVWALAPFAELGGRMYGEPELLESALHDILGAGAIAFGGLGLYWTLLGVVAAYAHRLVRFIFFPFAEGFRPRHGWWLAVLGIGLSAAAAATLIFVRGQS